MSVQWALPLLEKYLPDDLSSQLRESTANDPAFDPPDPSILPTYNGATGELLKNIELNRMIRVSRRRFRAFCAREIDVQVCMLWSWLGFKMRGAAGILNLCALITCDG